MTYGLGPNTPDGPLTVTGTATNLVGNHDPSQDQSWQLKIDRTPPSVAVSGSLSDKRGKTVDGGAWDLHVDATDGDSASPTKTQSGVARIEVFVNGLTQGFANGVASPTCTSDGCPAQASLDYVYDASAFPGGTTTIDVRASDLVGHVTDKTWQVTNSQTELACPTDLAFSVYHAGATFDGLPMTHALRGCDPAAVPFTRNDQVSYSYGDCHPAGNGQSCVDPIEVQSAPLCERHAAIYSAEPNPDDTPYQHTDLTIRGVPAASYDGGTTVEIYTADTTITIMGQDPAQVMRFASAVGPAPPSDVPDHATVFTTLPSGVPGVGAGLPDLPPPNQTTLASTKAC